MAEAVRGEQTSAAREGKSAHGGTIARLVQAVLKEGAYHQDHSDYKRSRDSLYDKVVAALGPHEEILVVRPGHSGASEILVKVGHEGECPLGAFLGGGTEGARRTKAIADLMQSKGIFAVHLGQDITRSGFHRFLDAIALPGQGDDPVREGRALDRRVRALNLGASGIIADASLTDRASKLDWRVNLALARMYLALHEVAPPGRDGQTSKTRTREMASLAPALETLGSPAAMKDLLLHLDALETEAVRLPDIDLVSETVRRFPREVLPPVVEALLAELEKGPAVGEAGAAEYDRVKHLIGAIVPHLLQEQSEGQAQGPSHEQDLMPLMRELLKWNLVDEEKLPARMRETMRLARAAEKFMDKGEEFLAAMESTGEAGEYSERADLLVSILPHLAQLGRIEELERILIALDRHKRQWEEAFPARSLIAEKAVLKASRAGLAPMLEIAFRTSSRNVRESLIAMFQILKDGAVPTLIKILKQSEDRSVRRDAITALRGVGEAANCALFEELGKAGQEWFVVRNLILVQGEVGTMAATPLISQFLKHENARVREEAMAALARLGGSIFEAFLVEGLRDADTGVKMRALGCLEGFQSRHAAVLEFLCNVLGEQEREATEIPVPLQIAACRYLAKVGGVEVDSARKMSAQDLLMQRLRERGQGRGLAAGFRRVTSFLRGAASPPGRDGAENVRAAACEALGAIGDEKALGEMSRLAAEADPALQRIAQEAYRRIKERTSHETVPK